MLIYNAFYSDGCDITKYLGSAFTEEGARNIIEAYGMYWSMCDLDTDEPIQWVDKQRPHSQGTDAVYIVNPKDFESWAGWVGDHFIISTYNMEEESK